MATGLATRCSACGTVFRVVPDQLRVSEGWVRCGRCAEVFNAAEALLDLETGAPLPDRTEAPPRAMAQFSSRRPSAAPLPPPSPPAAARKDAELATPADYERYAHPPPAEPRPPPAAPSAQGMPVVDDTASRFADDAADERAGPMRAAADDAGPPADLTAEAPAAPVPTPLFVRQAERAARWRRPQARGRRCWPPACWPRWGWWRRSCRIPRSGRRPLPRGPPGARTGLRLAGSHRRPGTRHRQPRRRQQRAGAGGKVHVYRLSVALRNRAALEVALPALELSLTDSQGQLVARRVLPMSGTGREPGHAGRRARTVARRHTAGRHGSRGRLHDRAVLPLSPPLTAPHAPASHTCPWSTHARPDVTRLRHHDHLPGALPTRSCPTRCTS